MENKTITGRIAHATKIPGRGIEIALDPSVGGEYDSDSRVYLVVPSIFGLVLDLDSATTITISTTNDEKPVDPTANL